MEVDYIKEFLVLAELCNYYETAKRLYITQPTLTKHIQRLEKNIGASLFDRSTRRVELTEFGKAFIPYARQMADAQDSFMSVVETEL